ncbi:MAG: SGNH/GDSL hydrolase family protein [Thermostichus sp. BF3_bins_97]
MVHVVLLGDSIFDNGIYVPDEPCLSVQLGAYAEQVTLLAVDGDVTVDVMHQAEGIPASASHLFVSVGGNDALKSAESLISARSGDEVLEILALTKERFSRLYRQMVERLQQTGLPLGVCTIYDRCPFTDERMGVMAAVGLSVFNDEILRLASEEGLAVVDLRVICTEREDYSSLSPIEPSAQGGEKIAGVIAQVLEEHDFGRGECRLYGWEG